MDVIKEFNTPFKGLGTGTHHYDFDVDNRFFAAFGESVISGGKAKVCVELNKASGTLVFNFSAKGEVMAECDRCLDDCTLPIDFEDTLTVKFSDKVDAGKDGFDGEVLWLNTAESEINIAQYIYESIVLSLPYQRIHPEDENGNPTCNPDMLQRFSIVSEEEFEKLTAPEEQKMEDNPEFAKLLAVKEQMEKENK